MNPPNSDAYRDGGVSSTTRSAWKTRLPSIPRARPLHLVVSGTPGGYAHPEAELARLLRRVSRPAQIRSRPSLIVDELAAGDTTYTKKEVRPQRPSIPDIATRPSAAPSRPIAKPALDRVATGLGIAVGMGLAAIVTAAGLWGNVVTTRERVERLETRVPALSRELQRSIRDQDRRIAELHAEWTQFSRPSTVFTEAGDLMKAGRWVDAEAAYSRFLIQHPGSRLDDLALRGAAVAAAMAGNCNLATSRLATLRKRFPNDATGLRGEQVLSECRARVRSHG